MLFKQSNPKILKSLLFTSLLTLLASCGNTSALESMIQADPSLTSERTPAETEAEAEATANDNLDSDSANNSSVDVVDSQAEDNEIAEDTEISADNLENSTVIQLPGNFPPSFPIYPRVELQEAESRNGRDSGMLSWTSPDNSKAIADYYQAELNANGWNIVKPFDLNDETGISRAIATKDNHKVHLTLLRSRNQETGNDGTKLSAIYELLEQDIAASESKAEQPKPEPNAELKQNQSELETATQTETDFPDIVRAKPDKVVRENALGSDYVPVLGNSFEDLDSVPEPLSQPLATVSALGILTPYTGEGNIETSKFAPNAIITRGEYARWLIAANNLYYEGNPGKKIYTVNSTSQPAFNDIQEDNPDFGAIQGLAEAGLVPSRLTQDSTKLLFRPNAPLTREDLITWKVPLDTRQALPKASIEAIEESWGFQDAANIDSSAVRALYADYQNGDRSNVRRIFGFTTLFQAKKPVTRAEAAASLWYFGFQGDGITAQEILESETESELDS